MSDTSKENKKVAPKNNSYQIVLYVGVGLIVLSIILLIICYSDYGWWYYDNIFEHFFYEFFYEAFSYIFLVGIVAIIVGLVLGKNGADQAKTGANVSEKNDSADIESLMRLKTLLDSGVITQEEFDAKKEKLLK